MTEASYDEKALVLQAQGGDATAFESLLRQYQGRCWRLAVRMLGSGHDANDVLQESFLAAWQALGRFRHDSAFAPWLLTIVSHRCLNALRSRRRSRSDSLDELEGVVQPVSSEADADPVVAWERHETAEKLQRAIDELPPGPKAIVVLHYTEGLGCQAIANMLGMGESAVKVSLFRARGKLRETLARQEGNFA
jgi:RNA polymerase sigma-70 factor (ECF subfamily)